LESHQGFNVESAHMAERFAQKCGTHMKERRIPAWGSLGVILGSA
jgi:hypothetical protein